MIVADTGPLIAFARAGRLTLLRDVLGELIIPDAVIPEVKPELDAIRRAGYWIDDKTLEAFLTAQDE